MYIVILTQGFVYACADMQHENGMLHLYKARCIETYGTSQGLGELVNGPLKATTLNHQIPILSAPNHALVSYFEVGGTWANAFA